MEFSRQEYWSGLPFSSPGDLPDPGTALRAPALQADSLPTEPLGKPQTLKKKFTTVFKGSAPLLAVVPILCNASV